MPQHMPQLLSKKSSSRRIRASLVAFASFALVVGALPAQSAETIEVVLDQAKVLQLPPNASTIIVGNPGIADVTMLRKNSQMILTGKGFGQTNMIALDADGNSVGESVVLVTGARHGLVVQRGMERETYSCAPRCQPTVSLGDESKFLTQTAGQVRARVNAAKAK